MKSTAAVTISYWIHYFMVELKWLVNMDWIAHAYLWCQVCCHVCVYFTITIIITLPINQVEHKSFGDYNIFLIWIKDNSVVAFFLAKKQFLACLLKPVSLIEEWSEDCHFKNIHVNIKIFHDKIFKNSSKTSLLNQVQFIIIPRDSHSAHHTFLLIAIPSCLWFHLLVWPLYSYY